MKLPWALSACFFLLCFFLTGIEMAFGIAITGILGYTVAVSFDVAFNLVAQDFFDTLSGYSLTVIPLFMLMGQIAFNAGIAKRLYDAVYKLVGRVPGGLAMATVVAATMFKAMCGSTLATAATFSMVAIPEMTGYNYSKKLSTGIVASVGTLGIILPPSITMIIFGIMTEQSIGKLFLAGIFPALLISFFCIAIIYVWCKIDPALGPKSTVAFTWRERVRALPEFIAVAVIFSLVIGGIMSGLFTPTEAGTIGTVAVLILALLRRGLTFKGFVKSIDESLRKGSWSSFSLHAPPSWRTSSRSRLFHRSRQIGLLRFLSRRTLIMVIICFFYLLGGSFIDDMAFMILATPILYPAIPKLGYDPIWFGVMIGITIMIGTIIPPVAVGVFVVKSITGESFKTIYTGVVPFLLSFIFVAALLFLFPQIATFLPYTLMGR